MLWYVTADQASDCIAEVLDLPNKHCRQRHNLKTLWTSVTLELFAEWKLGFFKHRHTKKKRYKSFLLKELLNENSVNRISLMTSI